MKTKAIKPENVCITIIILKNFLQNLVSSKNPDEAATTNDSNAVVAKK